MTQKKSSFPRTGSYVTLHAKQRPDHPAVLANGRPISYAMLNQDLLAMTQALRNLGLAPGSHAAVGHNDFYIQLLIVFGFENLGIATGSFRPVEGPECHSLTAGADITLVQYPAPPIPTRQLFEVTDAWVRAALEAPLVGPTTFPPAPADEVAIIVRSSGTTGLPKRMLVTHGIRNYRINFFQDPNIGLGLNASSRFLAVMHFSASASNSGAANCLRLGATVMFDTERGPFETLLHNRPTHVILLPFQLRGLLEKLGLNEDAGAKPLLPELTILSAGAGLPEDLRRIALKRLCGRVVEAYGSNEASWIAFVDKAGLSTVVETMDVEIVDDQGRPAPMGEAGQLRIRGAGLIQGYVDDPQATAQMFRDGWFYPGDVAALEAPGRFKLLGRPSDVLNLGGIKKACATLESEILERAPITDVALFQRNSAGSSPPVIVCIVTDGPADLPALAKLVEPIINFPFVLTLVTAIPRTEGGKIKRIELQQSLYGPPAAARALNAEKRIAAQPA